MILVRHFLLFICSFVQVCKLLKNSKLLWDSGCSSKLYDDISEGSWFLDSSIVVNGVFPIIPFKTCKYTTDCVPHVLLRILFLSWTTPAMSFEFLSLLGTLVTSFKNIAIKPRKLVLHPYQRLNVCYVLQNFNCKAAMGWSLGWMWTKISVYLFYSNVQSVCLCMSFEGDLVHLFVIDFHCKCVSLSIWPLDFGDNHIYEILPRYSNYGAVVTYKFMKKHCPDFTCLCKHTTPWRPRG